MSESILLLPVPRRMKYGAGTYELGEGKVVRLVGGAGELLFAGKMVREAIEKACGQRWEVVVGEGGGEKNGVEIRIDCRMKEEGYRLRIGKEGVRIEAKRVAGAFYGVQTLVQMLRQSGGKLRYCLVEDWPDFPVRGVMLDISRDKVPTMETLRGMIDRLAEWKINQVQLYTEHTFAYRGHREVWEKASPMTGEEILELDQYCRERHIELVPNQNSFGHMERWLKHERYRGLAEAVEGARLPNGKWWEGPFSLCPLDGGSIELLRGLYDELLPNFSSKLFNVGCDETFDLGQGRSKAECAARGKERVYLEFLLKIYGLIKERGRRMQFWGDIILNRPELIGELPEDVIAMEWGYEADHPFDQDGKRFRDAGVPFYVCPGTSSWMSIGGRTDNALANLLSAAKNGMKYGAIGYLNTDWGDFGHLQYMPMSYLGLAAGAAYSWGWKANEKLPMARVLDTHVFFDRAGVMGKVAYDLGNVYQKVKLMKNSSALFRILVPRAATADLMEGITKRSLDGAERAIGKAVAPLGRAKMAREDAAVVVDEFRNAAAMLRYACRRGRWMLDEGAERESELKKELAGIIREHRRLWKARNRIGGLEESVGQLGGRRGRG